jgi:hypothetical protein
VALAVGAGSACAGTFAVGRGFGVPDTTGPCGATPGGGSSGVGTTAVTGFEGSGAGVGDGVGVESGVAAGTGLEAMGVGVAPGGTVAAGVGVGTTATGPGSIAGVTEG